MHSGDAFACDILLAPRAETGLGQVASELWQVQYLAVDPGPTCFQLAEEIPSLEQSARPGGGRRCQGHQYLHLLNLKVSSKGHQ